MLRTWRVIQGPTLAIICLAEIEKNDESSGTNNSTTLSSFSDINLTQFIQNYLSVFDEVTESTLYDALLNKAMQ